MLAQNKPSGGRAVPYGSPQPFSWDANFFSGSQPQPLMNGPQRYPCHCSAELQEQVKIHWSMTLNKPLQLPGLVWNVFEHSSGPWEFLVADWRCQGCTVEYHACDIRDQSKLVGTFNDSIAQPTMGAVVPPMTYAQIDQAPIPTAPAIPVTTPADHTDPWVPFGMRESSPYDPSSATTQALVDPSGAHIHQPVRTIESQPPHSDLQGWSYGQKRRPSSEIAAGRRTFARLAASSPTARGTLYVTNRTLNPVGPSHTTQSAPTCIPASNTWGPGGKRFEGNPYGGWRYNLLRKFHKLGIRSCTDCSHRKTRCRLDHIRPERLAEIPRDFWRDCPDNKRLKAELPSGFSPFRRSGQSTLTGSGDAAFSSRSVQGF